MLNVKIYKTIGEIHNVISKSKSSDEALRNSLKLIVDSSNASFAVLWYLDAKDNLVHPFYWLCPMDLSSISISLDDGIIGKSISESKTIALSNLKDEDKKLFDSLDKLVISSMVAVPLANEGSQKGLISIFKEEGTFDEDEIDMYNILVMLIDTLIRDKFTEVNWDNKEKIMSISKLTKDFESGGILTQVLKGINFDIFEGEFLCLLGESGCGKSTLLNIIGGMDEATSGEVLFQNKDIAKSSEKELTEYRRNNIGFIFQNYNLMPNLTAKENLDLIGELVKNPLDSKEALALVGLQDKMNNYPSQLSGGQQQRVSIARALIKNPKIIMADEPTAALDYQTSIEVLKALENVIKEKHTTLVMVTHNEEISKMADRVIRFRNGKIYEISVNAHKQKAEDLIW